MSRRKRKQKNKSATNKISSALEVSDIKSAQKPKDKDAEELLCILKKLRDENTSIIE